MLVLLYIPLERYKGFVTSGVLFIYWTVAIVTYIIPVYSKILKRVNIEIDSLYLFLLTLFVMIPVEVKLKLQILQYYWCKTIQHSRWVYLPLHQRCRYKHKGKTKLDQKLRQHYLPSKNRIETMCFWSFSYSDPLMTSIIYPGMTWTSFYTEIMMDSTQPK